VRELDGMKTQDTDSAGISSPPPARKRRAWGAGIGALIVVAAVITASVIVFAQLAQRRNGTTQGPQAGQWEQVLSGYTLTSLEAVRSNPAVLYACATLTESPTATTVLRSADGGAHWQDVGIKGGFTGTCQLAVNPENSNEVYVVNEPATVSNAAQTNAVLRHSANSGQNWETIMPVMHISGVQSALAWHVQQITIAGKQLFGVQTIASPRYQPQQGVQNAYSVALSRLVTSVDKGHTWVVLDAQFQAASLALRSYAVDPTNTNTIYELIGRPILPVEPADGQPGTSPFPVNGTNGALYKTTTGGTHWQLLLNDLPFGATVKLASNAPQTIFAGGSPSPLPLAAIRSQAYTLAAPAIQGGGFALHISQDGGTKWQSVPDLPESAYISNWLVSPNGRVYLYNGSFYTPSSGGQATGVPGTIVPAGTTSPGQPIIQVPGTTPTENPSVIYRYDPGSSDWKTLKPPQKNGMLLAVTASQNNGGTALWFISVVDGKMTLYREVT
jgi:hypothetical protein